jgi:hypothetical protein
MKYKILFFISAAIFLLSSCVVLDTKKSMNIVPEYQLQFRTSDLELLGDLKGEINYTQYLGVINTNRRSYVVIGNDSIVTPAVQSMYYGNSSLFSIPGGDDIYVSRLLYELQKTKPEAEIIVPVYVVRESQNMFLGSYKTITVKAKAYKIK